MKSCTKCKVEKSLDEFRADSTKLDGKQSFCRSCAKALQKKRYIEKYQIDVKEKSRLQYQENRTWTDLYKKERPCICCGEKEVVCLAFHHRDYNQKEFSISQNMGCSSTSLQKEITKCVVICHNCHAKLHAGLIRLPNSIHNTLLPYFRKAFTVSRDRDQKRARTTKERLEQYKLLHPCISCKESSTICLSFHHKDASLKSFTISMGHNRSWDSIQSEIDKCAVLCHNCHAKAHANLLTLNF